MITCHNEWSATAITYSDGDRRMVDIRDHTDLLIGRTHTRLISSNQLMTQYRLNGLMSSADSADRQNMIYLGRPDLLTYRCGYRALGTWHEFPDGTWRAPAQPCGRSHTITATPLRQDGSLVQILITGADNKTIANIDPVTVDRSKDPQWVVKIREVLSEHGWSTPGFGHHEILPGGVLWMPARRGRLADRPWCTDAIVKIIHDVNAKSADGQSHLLIAGTRIRMSQSGDTGDEVDRDMWDTDQDDPLVVPDRAIKIGRVLICVSPWWDEARLDAPHIELLLDHHHHNAHEISRAWDNAGLHVAHERYGLSIRTKDLRQIGYMPRSSRTSKLTGHYEAFREDGNIHMGIPIDPVAAATAAY